MKNSERDQREGEKKRLGVNQYAEAMKPIVGTCWLCGGTEKDGRLIRAPTASTGVGHAYSTTCVDFVKEKLAAAEDALKDIRKARQSSDTPADGLVLAESIAGTWLPIHTSARLPALKLKLAAAEQGYANELAQNEILTYDNAALRKACSEIKTHLDPLHDALQIAKNHALTRDEADYWDHEIHAHLANTKLICSAPVGAGGAVQSAAKHKPHPGLNWFRYSKNANWDVVLVDQHGFDGLALTLSFTQIHATQQLVSRMDGEWGGCFVPMPPPDKALAEKETTESMAKAEFRVCKCGHIRLVHVRDGHYKTQETRTPCECKAFEARDEKQKGGA